MSDKHCPKCGELLRVVSIADVSSDSKFALKLTPGPGQRMDASSVGGSLVSISKIIRALGKENGAATSLLLEKMHTDSDGSLVFQFICSRNRKTKPQAARRTEGK